MKSFIKITIFLCIVTIIGSCSETALKNSDLVFIEGGTFMMGNTYETAEPDEKAIHKVRVNDFRIGKHEISVGEFRDFVQEAGYITTAERSGNGAVFMGRKVERPGDGTWKKPYFTQHDRHPAVCVSWWDAIEYCNWRSRQEGLRS